MMELSKTPSVFDVEKFLKLNKKFKFLQYNLIVIVMNIDNSHFYLTTVDMNKNIITHRESLNPPMEPHQFKFAKCLAIGMEMLRRRFNGVRITEPWQMVYSPNTTHQKDSESCCIIAILYALCIFGGMENKYQIPFDVMQPKLNQLRKSFFQILREGILPLKDCDEISVLKKNKYGFCTAVFTNRKCSFSNVFPCDRPCSETIYVRMIV